MMHLDKSEIPNYALNFFNDVNTYIGILPSEFKDCLTRYMYFLAWQITENCKNENPDEHFEMIKQKYAEAKRRAIH